MTSLAHPGGNITGNTILGPDIVTKKLQILKDAFPGAAAIGLEIPATVIARADEVIE